MNITNLKSFNLSHTNDTDPRNYVVSESVLKSSSIKLIFTKAFIELPFMFFTKIFIPSFNTFFLQSFIIKLVHSKFNNLESLSQQ